MVEILITMFVLAIGLLGVASLQFVGSFTNAEALSRTQGEMVAQQAAERLRVAAFMDTVGDGMVVDDLYFAANNYNFDNLSGCVGDDPFACHCTALPGEIPDCEGGLCSQAEMAVFDAWVLSCAAVQANPQTTLSLSCTDNDAVDAIACSAGSFIQIQLRWPVRTQQNAEAVTDDRCVQETDQAFGCVTKVVTL
ncbi:pilus assembly protein PilV [Alteromonas sediminis]|uniref:Pilus assembly protein PilV n=1 Tax=Alteromonas sediminis TaxID=2259342 RepID=A0A3N5Z5M6_9ALTE|nr:pilus assembly protein PilV [Alteromonas sediminis]RPJ65624.1 pilus assembly protein PilV [Alteromonas sediminis]